MLPVFSGCEKEEDLLAGDLTELVFSCDTLAFDTVFTQMGTTTRQVKIYNRGEKEILLSRVTLREGYLSRFRLNVDGDTNMVVRNVRIGAGDSIFVFVRANINPNSATEPFLVEDAILISNQQSTGASERRLPLTAYGRNAVYHVPTDTLHYADGTVPLDMYGNPYAYSVIDCDNWRHDLPHVVIGYAVVDSRNTLRLTAGDELYFYNDAVLWVYDSATLNVQGTDASPVLFTSVRHDGWYDGLPGQWGHVWISKGSWNSVIDHAVIENGFVGLLVDSCANSNPTLILSNTEIRNHTLAGLIGQTAYITGNNLLVTNCGTATVVMQYGGRYDFRNCTFADYWRYDVRNTPSVIVSNYREYEGVRYVWQMDARLQDCIVYGSRSDGEMLVDEAMPGDATVNKTTVVHSIVRGGEWDEDPKFVDVEAGDYHLQEDSPAIGIGWGG